MPLSAISHLPSIIISYLRDDWLRTHFLMKKWSYLDWVFLFFFSMSRGNAESTNQCRYYYVGVYDDAGWRTWSLKVTQVQTFTGCPLGPTRSEPFTCPHGFLSWILEKCSALMCNRNSFSASWTSKAAIILIRTYGIFEINCPFIRR